MSSIRLELRIYDLLLAQLELFVQGLDVADYPNRIRVAIPNKEISSQDGIYLKASQVPAITRGPTLETTREFRGVFLVNIVTQRNTGLREAIKLGSAIVDFFYDDTQANVFFDEDIAPPLKIKIDRQPNIRPPLYESKEVMVPVLINYHSLY